MYATAERETVRRPQNPAYHRLRRSTRSTPPASRNVAPRAIRIGAAPRKYRAADLCGAAQLLFFHPLARQPALNQGLRTGKGVL